MKITIDPDIDLIENLELTIKILQSKIDDRDSGRKTSEEALINLIKNLEESIGDEIPIKLLKDEHNVTDESIESIKQLGVIYEFQPGSIKRLK